MQEICDYQSHPYSCSTNSDVTLIHLISNAYFFRFDVLGHIYDVTGRSLETVVIFGTVQAVGGMCLMSIPFLQKYLSKNSDIEDEKL